MFKRVSSILQIQTLENTGFLKKQKKKTKTAFLGGGFTPLQGLEGFFFCQKSHFHLQ